MKNCCESCSKEICAKKVPIFAALSENELTNITYNIVHKKYKKNQILFSEGNEANTLYFVNEGKIKLYKYTREGKEQILHILSEGDFFGESNLLKESKYRFNAKTLDDCKICSLNKEEFKDMLIKNPEVSIKILEAMGEKLTNIETLAQNLATNDIDARIAYLLMELSDKYGQEDINNIKIDLPINREDMANYIGVTRETISRKLKKFQADGLIKLVGTKKIIINNKEKLIEYI